MRLETLCDADAEVAAWVFARLPYGPRRIADMPRDWFRALGVLRGGRLCGGAVWHDRQANGGDVQISVAGVGPWLDRGIVREILLTPFERFSVAHVTARTAADNRATIHILERTGWAREGRQALAWDGVQDAVLYGMTEARARKWAAQ